MSNYNIEIDLLKLKGAKVADVQGKTQTKKCVCVPIDNSTGTVTDAYITRDQETGKRVEVKKKGVRLNLIAYEMQRKERGQPHLVKPSLSKEAMEQLPEDQARLIPWIGNMKPWNNDGGNSGSDW
jgi:hypothetical protein